MIFLKCHALKFCQISTTNQGTLDRTALTLFGRVQSALSESIFPTPCMDRDICCCYPSPLLYLVNIMAKKMLPCFVHNFSIYIYCSLCFAFVINRYIARVSLIPYLCLASCLATHHPKQTLFYYSCFSLSCSKVRVRNIS